ncbi:hypothetical protein MLD38_000446 [Melastoma candidum]|uniref:Uncharacterized protein n=1 Tax=Melastoma candidum TaxID=119954 RepID=A0ACB9S9G1_9MYRT|nr:hypothetical protein MLD38_000446 [Melastoma candidum]
MVSVATDYEVARDGSLLGRLIRSQRRAGAASRRRRLDFEVCWFEVVEGGYDFGRGRRWPFYPPLHSDQRLFWMKPLGDKSLWDVGRLILWHNKELRMQGKASCYQVRGDRPSAGFLSGKEKVLRRNCGRPCCPHTRSLQRSAVYVIVDVLWRLHELYLQRDEPVRLQDIWFVVAECRVAAGRWRAAGDGSSHPIEWFEYKSDR